MSMFSFIFFCICTRSWKELHRSVLVTDGGRRLTSERAACAYKTGEYFRVSINCIGPHLDSNVQSWPFALKIDAEETQI